MTHLISDLPQLAGMTLVTSTHRGQLHSLRTDVVGRWRALHRRWKPVSSRLRRFQTAEVRRVTARRDFGLLALLVVLMAWGDTSLPRDFLLGMKAVGTARVYGVFPIQPEGEILLDALFQSVDSHNQHVRSQLRPNRDDNFMLAQSIKDADAGFCTQPMTHSQLLRATQGKPFRLIPRCVLTQSSGKQRIIDNADVGGQFDLSSDPNKLILCSPLRPAQHLAVTMAMMSESHLRVARENDSWEGGEEDWPDAYRHCPMPRHEALACVVAFWHHGWATPTYQVYTGLLFGLPLAVTSFTRYSRFVEAAGRRLAWVMVSSHVDDSHLSDWGSSEGSGQWAFRVLKELLGTPFSDDKRHLMAATGTFLGLDFDMSPAMSRGTVAFFVGKRLVSKVGDLVTSILKARTLRCGLAFKLYGMLNFLELGMFGRVGAGGLQSIRDRQLQRGEIITPELLSSLEVVQGAADQAAAPVPTLVAG